MLYEFLFKSSPQVKFISDSTGTLDTMQQSGPYWYIWLGRRRRSVTLSRLCVAYLLIRHRGIACTRVNAVAQMRSGKGKSVESVLQFK